MAFSERYEMLTSSLFQDAYVFNQCKLFLKCSNHKTWNTIYVRCWEYKSFVYESWRPAAIVNETFLWVTNLFTYICNNIRQVGFSSNKYMSNNFIYTSGIQPDEAYFGVNGTCSCSLHFLHYSCALADYILLLHILIN
jgi:hypothetical protein